MNKNPRLFQYRWLSCLGIASSLTMLCVTAPSTAQTSSPQPQSSPSQPALVEPMIGWEFDAIQTLNQVAIREDVFQGECPGKETYSQKARFTSSKTPPAPGRRVLIRNVSRGIGNSYPYTDREYDKARVSEATNMAFGTDHDRKRFHVIPGDNLFEYEIRDDGRVIDSGKFTARIDLDKRMFTRDSQLYTSNVCADSSITLNVCADVRKKTEYKCPNGNVLRSFMEPEDSEIATLVSNQTYAPVFFSVNGDVQRLEPGDRRLYRTSQGSYLNVRFNPACSTCEPTSSTSIRTGKRYKFSKSSSSEPVQLVDYPK